MWVLQTTRTAAMRILDHQILDTIFERYFFRFRALDFKPTENPFDFSFCRVGTELAIRTTSDAGRTCLWGCLDFPSCADCNSDARMEISPVLTHAGFSAERVSSRGSIGLVNPAIVEYRLSTLEVETLYKFQELVSF